MPRSHAGLAGWALMLVLVLGAFLAGAHARSADGPVVASSVTGTSPAHGPTCDEPSPTPAATSRTTTRCAGLEPAPAAVLLVVASQIGSSAPRTATRSPVSPSAGRPRLALLGIDRN